MAGKFPPPSIRMEDAPMEEIWKDVPGYEGLYQVSDNGNVRRLNWNRTGTTRNITLKPHKNGYRQVLLAKNGKRKMFTVHRLVAMVFIPNPDGLPHVNHIDENKANNIAANLEWCSPSYNVKYSIHRHPERRHGTVQPAWRYGGRMITQFDSNGNLIKIWEGTPELIRDTTWGVSNIVACCSGKRKTAYGFKWRFADEYDR